MITNLRKVFSSVWFTSILSMTILLSTTEQIFAKTDTSFSEEVSSYTGEQLLKSFLFADGPATALIPAIRNNLKITEFLKGEEISYYRTLQNEFVAYLNARTPGFLNNFKTQMESGNPMVIEQGILLAGQKFRQFTDERMQYGDIPQVVQSYLDQNGGGTEIRIDAQGRQDYENFLADNGSSVMALGIFSAIAVVSIAAVAVAITIVVAISLWWGDEAPTTALMVKEVSKDIALTIKR